MRPFQGNCFDWWGLSSSDFGAEYWRCPDVLILVVSFEGILLYRFQEISTLSFDNLTYDIARNYEKSSFHFCSVWSSFDMWWSSIIVVTTWYMFRIGGDQRKFLGLIEGFWRLRSSNTHHLISIWNIRNYKYLPLHRLTSLVSHKIISLRVVCSFCFLNFSLWKFKTFI